MAEIRREMEEVRKSAFAKFIDKMCELHPECENYHETKVIFCEEFLKTIKGMQGTDLEPYLAEIKVTSQDGCFNISFKVPLVSYEKLRNLQSRK